MAVLDQIPGRPVRPGRTPSARPRPGAEAASGRLPWTVAVYVLCVVLPIGFEAGPLALSTLRLLLLLLVVPLTVNLLMGRYGRIYAIDVLFVLHLVWATVTLVVNNPDMVIEQTGSVGVEFLGGYLVGRAYVRTADQFVALCRLLVAVVLVAVPFAAYEALTGDTILLRVIRALPGIAGPAMVDMEPRLGLERVQMTFAHPIHYGLFCSIVFSLAFVALKDLSGTTWRIASSALIALGCFLSLSSGALLAILLQFGLIAWSVMFARVRRRWWVLAALLAAAYVAVDLASNRKPLDVFMTYATFSAHTAYWRSLTLDFGLENVWANPILGIGHNDWVRPSWMFTSSIDNYWLLMAMRHGIPGFLLVALGYGIGVARIMRRDVGADPVLTHLRRAWVFTFLGLGFTLCTVHVWTNIYSFVFFLFGAGIWLIDAQPRSPGEPPGRSGPDAVRDAIRPDRGPPRYSRFPAQGRLPA